MAAAVGTTPQFVATIDFGTTYCSVAYLLRPDLADIPSEVDPTVLTLDNAGNRRVPSCILFDPDGKKMAFGYEARDQYADLEPELRPQHHYFEHVKKDLQHKKTISAMNGEEFFLVDVIAHILHDLKCRLLTALVEDEGLELKASDIDWVITMPAIKEPKEEEMMREAGYKAGLCSDTEPPNLSITTKACSQPQKEKSPEKLSLILEPESAAVHCRRKAEEAGRGSQYVVRGKNYLVVDIGGGTVDIASHKIVGGRIEELAPPDGNFWGGTTVNGEFSKFLQKFVGDPEFSCYIDVENSSPEEYAQHKADLNELIYTRFEKHKRRFGSCEACNSYTVKFPHSFWKMYQAFLVKKGRALDSKGDNSVRVEDDCARMRIRDSKMAEFFQPALGGITDLIETYLTTNRIARAVDTIYWVGGFGGCKYLRTQLEKGVKEKFKGCKYQFSVPPEPEFAVIRGATAFLCDPSTIARRNSDFRHSDPASSPRSDETYQQLKQQQSTSFNESASTSTPQNREHVDSPSPKLAEENLLEITDYLLEMQNDHLYNLGLVLGLKQGKVKAMMNCSTFRDDVIAAWLREEDNVKKKGEPSWTVLVDALKHPRVGQTGIASKIAKEKGIKIKP